MVIALESSLPPFIYTINTFQSLLVSVSFKKDCQLQSIYKSSSLRCWCHTGVTLVPPPHPGVTPVSLWCWCWCHSGAGVTPVLVLVSLRCWCHSGITPVSLRCLLLTPVSLRCHSSASSLLRCHSGASSLLRCHSSASSLLQCHSGVTPVPPPYSGVTPVPPPYSGDTPVTLRCHSGVCVALVFSVILAL